MKKPRLGNAALGQLTGSNVGDVLHRLPFTRELQEALREVPPGELAPNPWQPREDPTAEDLQELRESVREHGILEPLLVRRLPDGSLQVLAGHRRLAAAQLAGLPAVPVRELTASDTEARAIALTENLAREDLAPWEEAQGLAGLRDALREAGEKVTRDKLAALAGRSAGATSESLAIADALTPDVLKLARVNRHTLTKLPKTALLGCAQASTPAARANRLKAAVDAQRRQKPPTAAVRRASPGRPAKPYNLTVRGDRIFFRLRKPPAALEPEEARDVLARLAPVLDALRERAGLPPAAAPEPELADVLAGLPTTDQVLADLHLPTTDEVLADLDALNADVLTDAGAARKKPARKRRRKRG